MIKSYACSVVGQKIIQFQAFSFIHYVSRNLDQNLKIFGWKCILNEINLIYYILKHPIYMQLGLSQLLQTNSVVVNGYLVRIET